MRTLQLFNQHNQTLASGLIDNEPVECRGAIDPKDPIFDLPLNSKYNGSNELAEA